MRKDYELTLYESLRRTALKYPKYRALHFEGHFISYERMLHQVDLYATNLVKLGIKKDDCITLCLPNVPGAIYLLYALNKIGAKLSLVHPLMNKFILKNTMMKTSSHLVFVLDTMKEEFLDLEKDESYPIKVAIVDVANDLHLFKRIGYKLINRKKLKMSKPSLSSKILSKGKIESIEIDDDIHNDRFYLQSGGTSGASKTIALSNLNINANVRHFFKLLDLKTPKNQYMLAVLPMFHAFGLCMGIHVPLYFGGVDMLMPKFNAKKVASLIKHKHLSFIIGIPLLYQKLLREKTFDNKGLKYLNVCFVGGDFVDQKIIDEFNDICAKRHSKARLYRGYGLTELSGVVSLNTHREHDLSSVGKVLDDIDVMIRSEDGKTRLKDEEDGLIYLSGKTLMNGYLNNNDNSSYFIDEKGLRYFNTGDYGHITKDRFLIYKQRAKSIIKVKGINVFPNEIEDAIKSLDFVHAAKVIGIPDEDFAYKICLFIVKNRNAKQVMTDEQIKQYIDDKCGKYARPHIIKYIDKMPFTNIGKVDVNGLIKYMKSY